MTVSMKAKQLGLRLPDRIISIYPTFNTTTAVSPSRIMTLLDILLPVGALLCCQQVYFLADVCIL